jgi:hypothetical protein
MAARAWDLVVLTCKREAQAKALAKGGSSFNAVTHCHKPQRCKRSTTLDSSRRSLVNDITFFYLIIVQTDFITVEDPHNLVGSGGATLNALLQACELLSAKAGHTVLSTQVLTDNRVLILHLVRMLLCAYVCLSAT